MPGYRKKDMVKLLKVSGFHKQRNGKGSNEIWKKDDKIISLSLYPGRETYHRIVKECNMCSMVQ